jgi:hypothetical protein
MIANHHTVLKIVLVTSLLGVCHLANAGQFYVGAQTTNLAARLDYGNGSETYHLNPSRIEVGWKEATFYWGVQALTSGSDTDVDLYGVTYEMRMDTSLGIFAGLNTTNFYIGFALQNFDTTYHDIPTTDVNNSNILTIGVQLGVQFQVVPNLFLYADYSAYAGKADYPGFNFTGEPDFSVQGLAGGVRFTF